MRVAIDILLLTSPPPLDTIGHAHNLSGQVDGQVLSYMTTRCRQAMVLLRQIISNIKFNALSLSLRQTASHYMDLDLTAIAGGSTVKD